MSGLDADTPPAGEQLHMPRPSLLPLLAAVGITFAIIGVTIGWAFTVIGLLILVPVVVRWIRSARNDIAELPPGH